jgi:hypothetical protein
MRRFYLALASAVVLALLAAAPASASFGFNALGLSFSDSEGHPTDLAGSHPFAVTTTVRVNTVPDPDKGELPDGGPAKDVIIKLPAGLVGNPTAIPRCPDAQFTDVTEWRSACPNSTVLGLGAFRVAVDQGPGVFDAPVYNLNPGPGVALKLGFVITTVPVTVDVSINPEPPHNAIASATNISQVGVFYGSDLTLWGNPADPAHDALRGSCLKIERTEADHPASSGKCPAETPERPFLTLPRSCTGPLKTIFEADAWAAPGAWVSEAAEAPGIGGCDGLGFEPKIAADPTSHEAAGPSGLDFHLNVDDPGLVDPGKRAQSDIKKAVVTLPPGMTVNPSQAEGLGACSPADYDREKLSSNAGDGCPGSSKIGDVEVQTPLLEGKTIRGSLYVAKPFDNPFGSLIAIYMVLRDPELGIFVKQAGEVAPAVSGPDAGRLTTTFDDLPQLPFSHFRLHFPAGGRSALVMPSTCGRHIATAVFTPWANPGTAYTTTSSFDVTSGPGGGPCPPSPPPFRPGFTAGSLDPRAGAFSPFYMRLTRKDAEQEMTRLSSILPPGVVGKLAGVAKCADAQIALARAKSGGEELALPSCPPASRLGRILAGAGAGEELTYVGGTAYLAGAYHGSPLSVAVITPAVVGPFDLGTVVVREALDLDPATAEVHIDGAASDSIPRILSGIPLRLRDLRIEVDRPRFMLNPTSCDPFAVRATLFGAFLDVSSPSDDVPAGLSERYQVAGCAHLGFKPKLSLRLTGGTKRNDHPALRAVLKPRAKDANVGSAVVTLPHSAFLEQSHIRTICTRVQFAADQCPAGSIYGRARAITPLLDEALSGPVYLRSSNHALPDLVAALHGVVDVELVGRIDSVGGRIRTSFESPPDAPVTRFVLRMRGGKKGLVVNSRDLCVAPSHARAGLRGQNGKPRTLTPLVKTSCGKAEGKRRGSERTSARGPK